MIKRTLRKIKEIDEYCAAELLEHNTHIGQRPKDDAWVSILIGEILDGNFLTGSIALALLKYDNNRKVMVNGQHQCSAVIKCVEPISVVYEEYECTSPSDLSNLYSRFDNHRARSLGHVLIPEAAALGIDWKRSIVRLVVSAAVLREDGSADKSIVSKNVKRSYLSKYLKEGAFINHILKDGITCAHMMRAPVVRAMMSTWVKNKSKADEFWIAVKDGASLPTGHPALVLRNYLLTTGLTKARTLKSSIATSREMYVKSIHAWNAFVIGKSTGLKYFDNAPAPHVKG